MTIQLSLPVVRDWMHSVWAGREVFKSGNCASFKVDVVNLGHFYGEEEIFAAAGWASKSQRLFSEQSFQFVNL